MKNTVLITGAHQGIGLALVEEYLQKKSHVIATHLPQADCSNLLKLKKTYQKLTVVTLDVTNEKQIIELSQSIPTDSIDVLINNAGICTKDTNLQEIEMHEMLDSFIINAVGPLLMTKHFLPLIKKSNLKTIVSISSVLGSISQVLARGKQAETNYAYKTSKTALNMIMANVAVELYDEDIKILLIHPGHVATAIGNLFDGPKISPKESAHHIVQVIEHTPRSREKIFIDYKGNFLPW